MRVPQRRSLVVMGKDFQESLCHLILLDRPFADQISEVLNILIF